jgi:SPP1 family predicted phage head-tail adaptor
MPKEDTTRISASKLNRRISMEEPTDTPDGQGGFTRTWTTVSGCQSVPAAFKEIVLPKAGDEKFIAQQVFASHWREIRIRYRPSTNITDQMRVRYGNKVFAIRAIDVPEEAQRVIVLLCEELQAQGSIYP